MKKMIEKSHRNQKGPSSFPRQKLKRKVAQILVDQLKMYYLDYFVFISSISMLLEVICNMIF